MGLATAEPPGPLTADPRPIPSGGAHRIWHADKRDHRRVSRSMTQPRTPAHAPGRPHPHGLGRHRRSVAAGTGVALGGALTYVALADPHRPSSIYPPCPFKMLTGWNCPFCGGLRMTHDLLHGDLLAGIQDNVFLLVALPLLAVWVLVRRARGGALPSRAALLTVVVVTIAWTVLRNLPAFPLFPTVLGG